jgi:hypothetical protein
MTQNLRLNVVRLDIVDIVHLKLNSSRPDKEYIPLNLMVKIDQLGSYYMM